MKPVLLSLTFLLAFALQAEDRKPAIRVLQNLGFGGILAQPSGGRLTLTADGNLVPEGPGVQASPSPAPTPARLLVSGPPRGRFVLQLDPPSPMLTHPRGGQVRVVSFNASLPQLEGTLDATGQAEIRLGGTLDIPQGILGGTYSSTQAKVLVRVCEVGWGNAQESFLVTARIQAPLTLTCTERLNFAGLLPGTQPGTFSVLPTGRIQPAGPSDPRLFRGTPRPAAFLLQGPPGTEYQIRLPEQTTLSGSTSTMVVDGFTTDARLGGSLPTGGLAFRVGATLHVGAKQPSGEYKGLFQVTVFYQ